MPAGAALAPHLDYRRPLAPAEPLNQGLLACWRCFPKRMSGVTWFDSIGRHHGTLSVGGSTSTIGWGPTRRQGGDGELRGDGTSLYVNIGTYDQYVTSTDTTRTLTAWFMQTARTTTGNETEAEIIFMQKATGVVTGFALRTQTYNTLPNQLDGRYRDSGNLVTDLLGTTTLAANTWYFGALVLNVTVATLYLNGVQEATASNLHAVNTFTSTAVECDIGRVPGDATTCWPGALDDIRMYRRALDADTIRDLYLESSRHRSTRLLNFGGGTAFPAGSLVSPQLPRIVGVAGMRASHY